MSTVNLISLLCWSNMYSAGLQCKLHCIFICKKKNGKKNNHLYRVISLAFLHLNAEKFLNTENLIRQRCGELSQGWEEYGDLRKG